MSGLLGAPLARAENGRALDHRPKSPGGRFICWDASAWCGCSRTECPHSHKKLGAATSLDRTVQIQLIRRGGMKAGPQIKSNEEMEKRVSALRTAQLQEDASKRKPPDKPPEKGKGKGKKGE